MAEITTIIRGRPVKTISEIMSLSYKIFFEIVNYQSNHNNKAGYKDNHRIVCKQQVFRLSRNCQNVRFGNKIQVISIYTRYTYPSLWQAMQRPVHYVGWGLVWFASINKVLQPTSKRTSTSKNSEAEAPQLCRPFLAVGIRGNALIW